MRRVAQVLVAVLVVVGVAVLARPSLPDAPEPFVVERETAVPRPSPTETADPEPTVAPEPSPSAAPAIVVHRFDPGTLVPLAPPQAIRLDRMDVISTDVSPDGRFFVLVQPAWPDAGSVLRLFDTERLDEPEVEIALPVDYPILSFSNDSAELLWAGHEDGGLLLGGLTVHGDFAELGTVELAIGREHVRSAIQALGGGRAGLHGYVESEEQAGPGNWDADRELGPVRLLVADLAAGALTLDVVLPTAPGYERRDAGAGAREMRAGVAWDGPRGLAYVAHADRDAVLVVELSGGSVIDELLLPPGDPASPATPTTPPSPEATDARESRYRSVQLSADGNRLYVSGSRLEASGTGGGAGGHWVDLPWLVADLEASQLAVPAGPTRRILAISGDASHVAVTEDHGGRSAPDTVEVLDGTTLESRWERHDMAFLAAAFTPDGSHLLLLSVTGEPLSHEGGIVLEALDVDDGRSVQSLRLEAGPVLGYLHAGIVVELHG